MSRFSKSDAKAAGWVISHEQKEEEIVETENPKRVRIIPASYRAEKYEEVESGQKQLITEEAESIGLLLEKINLYEEQRERKQLPDPPVQTAEPYEDERTGAEQLYELDDDGEVVLDEDDNPVLIEREPNTSLVVKDEREGTIKEVLTVREGEKSQAEAQLRAEAEDADAESSQEPGPQIYESELPAPPPDYENDVALLVAEGYHEDEARELVYGDKDAKPAAADEEPSEIMGGADGPLPSDVKKDSDPED